MTFNDDPIWGEYDRFVKDLLDSRADEILLRRAHIIRSSIELAVGRAYERGREDGYEEVLGGLSPSDS